MVRDDLHQLQSVHLIDQSSGQLDGATVQKTHFGGFSDDEDSGDEDEVSFRFHVGWTPGLTSC